MDVIEISSSSSDKDNAEEYLEITGYNPPSSTSRSQPSTNRVLSDSEIFFRNVTRQMEFDLGAIFPQQPPNNYPDNDEDMYEYRNTSEDEELINHNRRRNYRRNNSTRRPNSDVSRRRRRPQLELSSMMINFFGREPNNHIGYEQALEIASRLGNVKPEGLSPIELESLNKRPHIGREVNCTICLELIKKDTPTVVFSCGHCYHEICAVEWLKVKAACPTCRAKEKPTVCL